MENGRVVLLAPNYEIGRKVRFHLRGTNHDIVGETPRIDNFLAMIRGGLGFHVAILDLDLHEKIPGCTDRQISYMWAALKSCRPEPTVVYGIAVKNESATITDLPSHSFSEPIDMLGDKLKELPERPPSVFVPLPHAQPNGDV